MAVKNNDIDIVLNGKKTNEQGITIQGVASLTSTMNVLLKGVIKLENEQSGNLKGKIPDELNCLISTKPQDEFVCVLSAIDPPDIFAVYRFTQEELRDFRLTSGRLINEIEIQYNYDHDEKKYKSAITKHNPVSKLLYRESRASLSLKMLHHTRQAEKIADALLKTSSIPELICSFSHNLKSLYVEVGDIVSITHKAGLKEGGYIDALSTVSKKNTGSSEISYEVIMKSLSRLYKSELINLSQASVAGEPGITIEYGQGVATITIYADVAGYPPVEGAEVTINSVKKITDSNGQVRFNLDPGTYTAYIRASGYEDAEIMFTV